MHRLWRLVFTLATTSSTQTAVLASSVPLLWLHDTLLGVNITEPGGAKITIAPENGGLPFVAGYTCTPKGVVWVNWQPQQWRLEVEIPRDVQATVAMPSACTGKPAKATQTAGDVQTLPDNVFKIQTAGRYVFDVKR